MSFGFRFFKWAFYVRITSKHFLLAHNGGAIRWDKGLGWYNNKAKEENAMISISTPHQPNWKCDSCKYPNKHNTHMLIDISGDNIFLCRDCAETLGIMLLDHVREEDE